MSSEALWRPHFQEGRDALAFQYGSGGQLQPLCLFCPGGAVFGCLVPRQSGRGVRREVAEVALVGSPAGVVMAVLLQLGGGGEAAAAIGADVRAVGRVVHGVPAAEKKKEGGGILHCITFVYIQIQI